VAARVRDHEAVLHAPVEREVVALGPDGVQIFPFLAAAAAVAAVVVLQRADAAARGRAAAADRAATTGSFD